MLLLQPLINNLRIPLSFSPVPRGQSPTEAQRNLVLQNPQLRFLGWSSEKKDETLEPGDIKDLLNVEVLKIRNWIVSNVRLACVLQVLSGFLRALNLDFREDFDTDRDQWVLDGLSKVSLPALEQLFMWSLSNATACELVQCCPNLPSISFYLMALDDTRDLAETFRTRCPLLHSLQTASKDSKKKRTYRAFHLAQHRIDNLQQPCSPLFRQGPAQQLSSAPSVHNVY